MYFKYNIQIYIQIDTHYKTKMTFRLLVSFFIMTKQISIYITKQISVYDVQEFSTNMF